jgi:cell division protein FtsI/penicillin-binding protein 2
MYEMNPRNWRDNPRRDRNQITLTDALAKSCNVAFAKVALHWLDAGTLRRQADRFGFNRAVDFELPVDVSGARILSGEKSLASTAAGFGDVGLSPLHGAMIASMIANGGVMMAPRMVERVTSGGKEVYTFKEESLGRSLRPETADQLSQMMIQTIRKGTSRHAFSGWDPDILVGGKTGTLEGDNPPGDYNWFVGMAPINGARIAVAALVINRQLWHIKASYVAKEGLKAYFQKSRVTTISRNQASASKTGSRG